MGIRRGRSQTDGERQQREETILCITEDPRLLDECARVAAVAGVPLKTGPTFASALRGADDGAPVLLGADVADVPPRHRPDTVLVGCAADRERLWQRAAELGAEHVAELPEAAGWLVEFLGRRRAGIDDGTVLGVVGGCGGAGASTSAILLAEAASARGHSVLLVDGDRIGGGLELWLSEEAPAGLSWPDFAAATGRIHPPQLEAALPHARGVPFLSWPASAEAQGRIGPEAIVGVLEAGRRAFELVVIDVGRGREGIEDFAWASDRLLVVVPGRLRAALAASQMLHLLPPVPTGLLVRGRLGEGVDAERLAEVVGCPLVSQIPELRRAASAAEEGRLPGLAGRRAIRRVAEEVLAGLVDAAWLPSGSRRAAAARHARASEAA